MRIAMVSEHASPLAAVGGGDAGGQNVHVLELGTALAGAGHDVTVWTRRTDDYTPDTVTVRPGMTVRTVTAGPRAPVPKDELVPYLPAFARVLGDDWGAQRPDVVHAHFWMSGWPRCPRQLRGPARRQTFHALGSSSAATSADDKPARPGCLEAGRRGQVDRVVATCTDEVFELARQRAAPSDPVVPCGTAAFSPDGPVPREPGGDRRLGHSSGARASTRSSAPCAGCGVKLLVAGGPDGPAARAARPRPRRARHGRRRRRRSRTASACSAPSPGRTCRRCCVGRRRGLRAVVRAVRDRAAGGHGLRAPGGRQRGRRHPGHRRGPGDGPARAPAPARRGGRRAADTAGDAHPGTHVRRCRPGPRPGPLRLGPHRGLHARRLRGGARRAGGQARPGPGGRTRGPGTTPRCSVAR